MRLQVPLPAEPKSPFIPLDNSFAHFINIAIRLCGFVPPDTNSTTEKNMIVQLFWDSDVVIVHDTFDYLDIV